VVLLYHPKGAQELEIECNIVKMRLHVVVHILGTRKRGCTHHSYSEVLQACSKFIGPRAFYRTRMCKENAVIQLKS
jgi:hypothetical protein